MVSVWLTVAGLLVLTGAGTLAVTTGLTRGGASSQRERAATDEIVLIRPGHMGPEQRLAVSGSLLAVTHTAGADQAEVVFFQGARERHERTPSDPGGRPYGLFLTHDRDGRAALIVLDLSWLRDEGGLRFVNLMLYDPAGAPGAAEVRRGPGGHKAIHVLLHPQEDGSYLTREYRELAEEEEDG